MAKNNALKKYDELMDTSDSNEMESFYDDEAMIPEILEHLIEASNHQMKIAFDLTQLIAEKCSSANITEEKILAIFKRSSKVVSENFHLKGLWEKFS